jgi:hypothetical protein
MSAKHRVAISRETSCRYFARNIVSRDRGSPSRNAPAPIPFHGRSATRRPFTPGSPHLAANRPAFSFNSSSVSPIAGKRAATEMVDEQVVGDRQLEPGSSRPNGQVVVVEEPKSKPFVEPADGVINGPLQKQAEPRQFGHGKPLPAMLIAPTPSKVMHIPDITVWHPFNQLRRRGIVRHRPNQPDRRATAGSILTA